MYTLKTIDVWDTLLRRHCHPEFAKLATALHVFLDPALNVAAHYGSAWDVYRLRIEQEMLLADASRAAGKDNEYEITEVLYQWLSRIAAGPGDRKRAKQLADYELRFEMRHTYPDPTIRAESDKHPARKTLFLSDFYMSAGHLSALLRHHGIDRFVPDGISSCDLGLNKRSGNLFRHVHEALGVTPDGHVHIGDNQASDYHVPRELGIAAIHFLPEAEHALRLKREGLFEERGALLRQIQAEAAGGVQEAAEAMPSDQRAAFLAGVQTSALLIGFCLDVAERAIAGKLSRVYFFTREGEFFLRVWEALFDGGQLAGHDLPRATLLEVSRLATFCASLREITTQEMRRLWSLYTTHSLEALAMSLGIAPAAIADAAARHNLTLTEAIDSPWLDPRISNLFRDGEFIRILEQKSRSDRESLLAYLATQGLSDDGATVGVVDIGWRGTIQDNLAAILPSVRFHGAYLGLQTFLNDQSANVEKAAYGPDANRSRAHSQLLDAVSPVEMLLSSPSGSVSGYQVAEGSGRVKILRHESDMTHAASRDFVAAFQDGVLAAARAWAKPIETYSITAAELREPALAIWTELLARPHDGLVDAYAALNQNDVFGAGQFVSKRSVPGLGKLLRGVFSADARREVILYIRQTQWSAGIWARRDLTLVHRSVLMLVLQLAKAYKRIVLARSARNRTGLAAGE